MSYKIAIYFYLGALLVTVLSCSGGGGRLDSVSIPSHMRPSDISENANHNTEGNGFFSPEDDKSEEFKGASFELEGAVNPKNDGEHQTEQINCGFDQLSQGTFTILLSFDDEKSKYFRLTLKLTKPYLFEQRKLELKVVEIEDAVIKLSKVEYHFVVKKGQVKLELTDKQEVLGEFSIQYEALDNGNPIIIKNGRFICFQQ